MAKEEIIAAIDKKKDIASIFGKGKDLKINAQKMKDEGRRIWKMD